MSRAQDKPDTWTVRDICEAYEGRGGTHLVVPRFQRMLVWSEAKKRDLIQSVKQGFPIGSFLMFPRISNDRTDYLLIDGLQRSDALSTFRRQPMKWVDRDELLQSRPPLHAISQRLGDSIHAEGKPELEDAILEWLKTRASFQAADGWSAFRFVTDIFAVYERAADVQDLTALDLAVVGLLDNLKGGSNIDDFGIPVINYSGSFSNLPDIFERLNSKGTKLNKYEIFAAAWDGVKADFETSKITEAIRDRYRSFARKTAVELQVDPEKLGSEGFEFTLFEFFLGIDRALQEAFPYLFGAVVEGDETETGSASFNLIAAILDVPFNDMQQGLPRKLEGQDLDKFYARLCAACKELDALLKPILALPANSRRIPIYHAEYHVLTYIARIYMEMFDADGRRRNTWPNVKTQFKAALPVHYLYDILSDAWAGHGDSHLREMLGSRKEELLQTIPRVAWEAVLIKWFNAQLNRTENKVTRIDPTTVLFLKYLYSRFQTHFDALSEQYDGEHLVPKNRLKNMVKRDALQDGISISNVGNISFLHLKSNRAKRDKTLLENLRNLPAYANGSIVERKKIEKEVAEHALLTRISELDFDNANEDQGLTPGWYLDFCRHRFDHLRSLFLIKYVREEV